MHMVLRALVEVFVKPTHAHPPPAQEPHAVEDWKQL